MWSKVLLIYQRFALVIFLAGALGSIFAVALEARVWEVTRALHGPFSPVGGHAFAIDIGPLHTPPLLVARTDSRAHKNASRLKLFEDGHFLPMPHADHADMRTEGSGRYSHWGDALFFSASDNSDPNLSGKTYSISYPVTLPISIEIFFFMIAIPGILSVYQRIITIFRSGIIIRWPRTIVLTPYTLGLSVGGIAGLAIISWCVLTLIYAWTTGATADGAIAKYLPWSDATGWLEGSTRTLLEGQTSLWTARRPFNAAFFAGLLGLAGQNLRVALILRALLLGISCVAFARSVAKIYDAVAAAIAVFIVFNFARPFIPVTLSETTGLIFGLLGASVILDACRTSHRWHAALGIFLLAIGLQARPGAMFLLPFLVVWAGVAFTDKRRFSFSSLGIAFLGLAASVVVTEAVRHVYVPKGTLPFANFTYVLYGLAKGGLQWRVFFDDLPKLKALYHPMDSEQDMARVALRVSIELILQDPRPFLSGLKQFFELYLKELGSYLRIGSLRWAFIGLGGIGLAASAYNLRRRDSRLVIAVFAAVGISACFIYWNEDASRTLAVTVPFDAIVVALGVHVILNGLLQGHASLIRSRNPADSNVAPSRLFGRDSKEGLSAAAVVGLVAVVFAVVGPAVARPFLSSRTWEPPTCNDGLKAVVIHLDRGSPFIHLVDTPRRTMIPDVSFASFRKDPSFGQIEIADVLASLQPGEFLVLGYDLSTTRDRDPDAPLLWITIPGENDLKPDAYYGLCLRTFPTAWGGNVYSAESVAEARPGNGN